MIGASLRTDKDDMRRLQPPRLADVQIYDYGTDQVVWAVVDVRAGVVTEIVPILFRYQPPLTANERERAADMAWAHPDVVALLPEGDVLPTVHSWADGVLAPCNTHRCVSVAFYKEDLSWGFTFRAIVDLSAGRLIDVHVDVPGEAH